jgi:hypothetical protein
MAGGGRAPRDEYAARVNAAVELMAGGASVPAAARELAGRFGCSQRQARRYVERAAGGPMAVPPENIVFTVKLPVPLVARIRARPAASGRNISAVVAQGLDEFLSRSRRERPGR